MSLFRKLWLKTRIELEFLFRERLNLIPPHPGSIWKSAIRPYLHEGGHIVDAGAHVGADSVELARLFPFTTVHAFEPVPEIFHMLVRNTRRHKNIRCYNIALSDADRRDFLHVSSGASDASSSLLEPEQVLVDHPDVRFERTIEVSCRSLDSWAKAYSIRGIAFLWLDLQGLELRVLRASESVLAEVRAVHAEVSLRRTYSSVALYPELREWMASRGFAVGREAIPAGTDMGNVLFVRS